MNKCYKKVRDFALAQARKEGVIATGIKFLFQCFSNVFTQAIVTIVGTVVIGIMTSVNYFGSFFIMTVIAYCVSILLIAWTESYLREKVNEYRNLKQALFSIDIALRKWAISLQKCAKKLNNLSTDDSRAILTTISDIDFQTAAFSVCENLSEQLSKYYEKDDIYVTVFQKETDAGEDKCKMIAYSGNHQPSSYGISYKIPVFSEELYGKIEYHTYVFAKNETEISALHNHEKVEEAFKLHKECKGREEEIQQYVCVPISIAKLGVVFLLQIDTSVEGLFGKDHSTVINFAKTAIYPFAQFLHMIYEQGRTVEQLIKR